MLRARLSKKDHTTVFCVVPTCTGSMGTIPPVDAVSRSQLEIPGSAVVYVPPGFTPDAAGVWRLSQYALRERAHGRPTTWRRPPNSHVGDAERAIQWFAESAHMVCPSPRCQTDGAPQLVDPLALITERFERLEAVAGR